MNLAAGQSPHEPCVDGAKHQLTLVGTLARSGNIVENPLDFRRAEVGVKYQSGLAAYHLHHSLAAKLVAILRSAPVLPHDCVIYRLLGVTVPHDCGFALVGYAYRGYVLSVYVDLRYSLGYYRSLRSPYLMRIVLNPSRAGKYLFKFTLRHRAYRTLAVKYDGTRAACALVERQDVLLFHNFSLTPHYRELI